MKSSCLRLATFLIFSCTAVKAATLYVDLNNPAPQAPYASWSDAATTIQDAVDTANPGDLILVTNGIYQTGTRVVTGSLENRVVVDKAVTVQSVNGPDATTILGYQLPGVTNGDGAVRCVYLTNNATLMGFTLAGGATRDAGALSSERFGGAVYAFSSSIISNCLITGNAAGWQGGGVYRGKLYNCVLAFNAATNGGAAYLSSLDNCTISNNVAIFLGGGAYNASLNRCALAGNSATNGGAAYSSTATNCAMWRNTAFTGGASYSGTLYNCTIVGNSAVTGGGTYLTALTNCLVYYNAAAIGSNYSGGNLGYCCTLPLPTGPGNIGNEPQLTDTAHISATSPCRASASSIYAFGLDLDGEPWASPPSIGCDEYSAGPFSGSLSVSVNAETYLPTNYVITLSATINGHASSNIWNFDDGTISSNRIAISHSWAAPGDYIVKVTAYNTSHPGGVTASVSMHVVSEALYYVDAAGINPVAPYLSWSTAATNLDDALAVALPDAGARVLVTNGAYAPFVVNKQLKVQSVHGLNYTIIDGLGSNRCASLAGGATLDGFTLTNGFSGLNGGGVLCASTNEQILNSLVVNNTAFGSGGGVYGGTLENCQLVGNLAAGGGAGGGAAYSTLRNCTINSNAAPTDISHGYSPGFAGGAKTCVLESCVVSSNWCGLDGGGVYDCMVTNCQLTDNQSFDSGGGAAYSTLRRCVVLRNFAGSGGGAAYSDVDNCLIAQNIALDGGGIYQGTTRNSTIVGNSVTNNSGQGGGVYVFYSGVATNCIIYYNSAPNGPNFDSGPFLSFCCTIPWPYGVGNITNEPLFVNPTNDFRLQSQSPCINSGINSAASTNSDLDGNSRIVGGTVDIGAYEFQSPASVLSYAWAQQYGLPTDGSADFSDSDGDHENNWQEWIAGTNPTNASSVLKMLTPSKSGSGLTVSWQSVAGITYFLQRSTNWHSQPAFTGLQSNIVGQISTTSFTDTTATNTGPFFYRVGVQQ